MTNTSRQSFTAVQPHLKLRSNQLPMLVQLVGVGSELGKMVEYSVISCTAFDGHVTEPKQQSVRVSAVDICSCHQSSNRHSFCVESP